MNYQSNRYAEVGTKIQNELFPDLCNVKIAWLASDKAKKSNGRIIFGECSKVSDKYDWCCDYDFTITVYEPNVRDFTDRQIEILLEHELMHIGYNQDNGNMCIIPHDAEEFIEIIHKYGIDWSSYAGD